MSLNFLVAAYMLYLVSNVELCPDPSGLWEPSHPCPVEIFVKKTLECIPKLVSGGSLRELASPRGLIFLIRPKGRCVFLLDLSPNGPWDVPLI